MTTIDTHCCNEFTQVWGKAKGVAIEYSDEFNSWVLVNRHYADEAEVKMGEAEYVGELVSSSEIVIHYCPYCGVKL